MVNVQLSFQEKPFNPRLQFSLMQYILETMSLQNVKNLSKYAMFLFGSCISTVYSEKSKDQTIHTKK